MLGRVAPSPSDPSRLRFQKVQGGEYYQVCCPACHDTRFRLWFSHRWGTQFEGLRLNNLVVCFNEHCEQTEGLKTWLWRLRANYMPSVIRDTPVSDADVTAIDDSPHAIPGRFIPLNALPEQHAAVRYLQDVRGFNIDDLAMLWHVSWCMDTMALPPGNRLFFPAKTLDAAGNLILKGGQGRWLNPSNLESKPSKEAGEVKWFSIGSLSRLLYNGWRAQQQSEIVVVTEGPFDAIRVGPMHGVSLFGHTPSFRQKELLWKNWGVKGGTLVIALDMDIRKERTFADFVNWAKGWARYVVLELPDNKDPADFTHEELWKRITKQL